MQISHKWRPITDLPDEWSKLTDGRLGLLHAVWLERKHLLAERGLLDEFDKRLRREWSIETGIIEDIFTLERGVTRTLIAHGIDAALIGHGSSNQNPEAVARIIQDHYDALDGIFDFVGGQRELTTSYIKQLHAELLRNQNDHVVVDSTGHIFHKPLEKGKYKQLPNSPTREGALHEYCPPEHVDSEMDALVRMYHQHLTRDIPPEIEAAWLHHRFTQIHPFADGNGRVARALASLVFIKAQWFPLVINRDDRTLYIAALEAADQGGLGPLVTEFVTAQQRALDQITEMSHDAVPPESVDEAIAAVRDRLVNQNKIAVKGWGVARDHASRLAILAETRLVSVSQKLITELRQTGTKFGSRTVSGEATSDASHSQLVEQYGFRPDLEGFNKFVVMLLETDRVTEFHVFFCSLHPRNAALAGAVAFLLPVGESPVLMSDSLFQISGSQAFDETSKGFSAWLERAIVAGLKEWRKRV